MLERTITKIFNELIAIFVSAYEGDKKIAELLYDIRFHRCRIADRDHWKESRVYMHCGCAEMTICVSSSIDILSVENLQGLFAHEIGHIIHHQIPEILEDSLEKNEAATLTNLVDDELTADYLIERLFGYHVYYDNRKVQWLKLED